MHRPGEALQSKGQVTEEPLEQALAFTSQIEEEQKETEVAWWCGKEAEKKKEMFQKLREGLCHRAGRGVLCQVLLSDQPEGWGVCRALPLSFMEQESRNQLCGFHFTVEKQLQERRVCFGSWL